MDYIKRKPNVSVVIKRPDYSSPSCTEYTIVTFVPNKVSEEDKAKAKEKWGAPANYEARSDALLSYSYSESLYNVDSPFSLALLPETDQDGLTWIDKIAVMDLVYISEFDVVRYCGIIHQVRYSARMGQDGAARSIIVAGNGFGELLKSFKLQIDPKFWLGETQEVLNAISKSQMINEDNRTMKAAMDFFYNSFMAIVTKKAATVGGGATQANIKALIDDKIDMNGIEDTFKTILPLALSLYQPGVNDIWEMWQRIIPAPLCELFGRWEFDKQSKSLGKYHVIARNAPFSANDWWALKSFKIHPIVLTDYDVGMDDSEVCTYFYATAPNLGITENMSMVVDKYKAQTVALDEEQWLKYGYRPLGTAIRFLKRNPDDKNGIPKALCDVATMTKEWYSNNDKFLSGSISLISIDDPSVMEYPFVGAKALFLGGEFYIEQIDRKWTYGESPKTTLKVTRGYMYSSGGAMAGPIKNLGKRLKEFEATSYRDDNGGLC